jgi:D-alanyl-D-alanine carboxypeptidase
MVMSVTAQAASGPPGVSAQSAAVIDVQSGTFLMEKRADVRMRIASLTKVMTAIVAIEHANLHKQVRISKRATMQEGSSIYLQQGQVIDLKSLLYGLMLRSGNDSAVAIAEAVGGSVEGFAAMMNDTARYIGMRHSHFENPSGLDADAHYSTAHDMALLTAYALHNATFREIVRTPLLRIAYPEQNVSYLWRNKNKMLRFFDGADGVKTGFTKKAGRCLISSATRNGRQIAVVTLRASSDWVDHRRLLEYGFGN